MAEEKSAMSEIESKTMDKYYSFMEYLVKPKDTKRLQNEEPKCKAEQDIFFLKVSQIFHTFYVEKNLFMPYKSYQIFIGNTNIFYGSCVSEIKLIARNFECLYLF